MLESPSKGKKILEESNPKTKQILESPLRRSSRRLSQSEDEESSNNSPLKSAKKSVRIISDTSSAESESDDVFLKSARKRKLSERAPKLGIIPEVADEDQSAESPKKSRQGDNSTWSQTCAIREFLFGFK